MNLLECGKIINTHGTGGRVIIDSWCDSPEDFCTLNKVYKAHNADYIKLDITESQPYKGFVLARIAGIDNMDAAIAAKNTLLFAERDDLPKADGAHFIADLLGLSVYNAESGEKYGEISNIINRGASDIYVIETGNGEVMLPAVAEYVKEVDPERGIFITPIEGFFEN